MSLAKVRSSDARSNGMRRCLLLAGVAYAWLNGWLSRRDEREEAQHGGQVRWEPGRQAPQPSV
jgi:hypothetical protein